MTAGMQQSGPMQAAYSCAASGKPHASAVQGYAAICPGSCMASVRKVHHADDDPCTSMVQLMVCDHGPILWTAPFLSSRLKAYFFLSSFLTHGPSPGPLPAARGPMWLSHAARGTVWASTALALGGSLQSMPQGYSLSFFLSFFLSIKHHTRPQLPTLNRCKGTAGRK